MAGDKVKLLCSFGGYFVNQQGRALYVGGKTRLVSIERSVSFQSLLAKMSELCDADPSTVDIQFELSDGSLNSRLVSVETNEDVHNMMEEFDSRQKIPIFLFTDRMRSTEDEVAETTPTGAEDSVPTLGAQEMENGRVTETVKAEGPLSSQNGLSTAVSPLRRTCMRHPSTGPSMSGEIFRRDSESLMVGQEYEDVQTFRNALTSAAIAANFELHMIRSDQRRVTARCAAEGCTWRVHASKLPHVSIFRIRTLQPEHSCERSDDAGHRQATAKWIANCIRDKLRQNCNYKPREIVNDIHQEYGVLITYKRAFLGREKALEELRAEQPVRHIVPADNNYEPIADNSLGEGHAWGEIHDPPRKKRAYGRPCQPKVKDMRPLHCTRCNQIGHNRRTCTAPEPLQD